jgi:hypothetical protein
MAKMLGKVNLLGLNSLGQNPGMSPLFGAAIGGGVAGGTQLILRRIGKPHPEGFGLLAGLAVSGAMYAMKSTRHAAIAGAIGAFLASGIAWIDRALLPRLGLGIPSLHALNGLGVPMVRSLNGLGVPSISPVQAPVGIAGNQLSSGGLSAPPVSLMGPLSPQAASLRQQGGPPVHGLSAAYGATLMGGGR